MKSLPDKLLITALAALIAGNAVAVEPKYAGFDVTDQNDSRLSFSFSAGDASRTSPIVISVPGRKLTNNDRKYRVDLQKHWLSLHVPKGAQIISRSLNECGLNREGEYPFCDLYVFEIAGTKERLEYYIYVGNWP